MERKMQESDGLIANTWREIKNLDSAHPEYKREFLERYRQSLAMAGIPEHSNPLIALMVDKDELDKEAASLKK
jgi:hypothetical protein